MNNAPVSTLAIAHRAGNSLAGLHRATALGADVIEADVHQYRGRLEVRHFKTMGPLPWLWDKWELRSASAPRLGLGELLVAASPDVTFMLDLKGMHATVGEEVAKHLHELAPANPVFVCSRYWPSLRPLQGLSWVRTVRSARTRAELSRLFRYLRQPDKTRSTSGVSVHRSLLNGDTVAALHNLVEVVMTWPVNDANTLETVLAYQQTGTIGVISDEQAILERLLASRR